MCYQPWNNMKQTEYTLHMQKLKEQNNNQIASNPIVVSQVLRSNHFVYEQAYQNNHLNSVLAFISAA